METTSVLSEERIIREKVGKPLIWVSMVSMVMVFAGLTSAYVVRMEKGEWLEFSLPKWLYISTAIILLSSVTMNWVLASAKKNDFKNVKIAASITLLLGFAFIFSQFKAWGVLVDQKVVFAGSYSNAAGSFLYILTGLHLVHLVGGILSLSVVWVKSLGERYNSENLYGIRLCAIFWHFLDALWIYLFLFLLFVR
jgi:cytochrome c oxidase subunit III